MNKNKMCGLCIVNDNKVLFVNKDSKLSFPVVKYTTYKYTDVLSKYGLKSITVDQDLGVYPIGEELEVSIFGLLTDVYDESKYNALLNDDSMMFIDINMVEDYLDTHISLDEYRNEVDQMIIGSINNLRGIKEVPKQKKLVLTEE